MSITETTEKKLLEDIQNGKYRDCYLAYNRKSTDEPENQKNSLSYQKAETTKFSSREKIKIAPITIKSFCVDGIISEKHSGFKEDNEVTISDDGLVQYRISRPKFQQLVQFLSLGLFRGIIVLCWDRISRNKGDDTLVRKLMRKGIDVRFVYAKYEKTSSGALHMDIDGMFAEHHSRVTSEKVSINTRNLRERGIVTHRAPIGYLNEGNMEHKPLDPIRAPIIKKMFDLCATGDWSLEDLARWANKQGLTTVPMRRRRTEAEMLAEESEEIVIEKISRPVTANMVHKILTNLFYTGKTFGNDGQYVQSISHAPLVLPEIFNDVQRQLTKRKTSVHYTEKIDLPYRGIARCEFCHRIYTPYIKKDINYYFSRCVTGCPNLKKNFNSDFFEEKVGGLIAKLVFTKDELAEIEARTQTDIVLFEEKRNGRIEEDDRRKKKLREDLSYLRNNRLTLIKAGVYSPEAYIEEETRLNTELTSLQNAEQASDTAMHEVIKDVIKLSELLENVAVYWSFANSYEKEKIIRIIFSELLFSENTLNYKVKKGFIPFENRLNAVGDLTGI